MPTRHMVHPDLGPLLESFPSLSFDAAQLARLRRGFPQPPPHEVPGVAADERRIPGPAGAPDVRVLTYAPTAAERPWPAILHIHGGGYVLGAPEASDATNRGLAQALGCLVVSVDYRLAPETPYPGPLEDCYAALKWLHGAADELGADPARLAIKGESAGGGLAAGLALLARDRAEVPVALQVLTYPMLDDRPSAEPHPYVGEFIWTEASNEFGWTAYLGHERGRAGVAPYAAPARAQDLAGLPATFIATGALDLFLEENLEYARRLTRAGVATELHVYPGAYHGFPMAAESGPARRYEADVLQALAEAFAAG